MLTSGASTANAGRLFFKCAAAIDAHPCSYFLFKDAMGPECSCMLLSTTLTSNKPGPNQGRKFHTCAIKDGKCDFFFSWADGNNPPRTAAIDRPASHGGSSFGAFNGMDENRRQAAAPALNNGGYVCLCGIACFQGVVRKEGTATPLYVVLQPPLSMAL